MMTIETLKLNIINHVYDGQLIIFQETSDDFIARQYYHEISNFTQLSIEMIDELVFEESIFDITQSLKIYKIDKLDDLDINITNQKNLIIIAKSIKKEIKDKFSDYIVVIPKLEDWQIKDYVYSLCDGIRSCDLDYLIKICNSNINRLQCEIEKIRQFNDSDRQSQFNSFMKDDVFSDLTDNTIFNLTNAITQNDKIKLVELYKDLHNMDTGEMGFLTILYNGFKNIINIQLGHNPTPESCNLKPNQFWAIKKNIGHYSKEKLMDIFGYLTDIDKKIHLGDIDISKIIDYTIVKIMGDE